MNGQNSLIYVHDPMCSWCWGFRPVWRQLEAKLPAQLPVRYLLGGLAPDTDQPMPEALKRTIRAHWRAIQQRIPGTAFNFDFWDVTQPRRSTYPACRAVIAARRIDSNLEKLMIEAIQRGYYLQARNPSDESVLADFASAIGLERDQFLSELCHPETASQFQQEIRLARAMGVSGFPSLVLERDDHIDLIEIDYLDPNSMLERILTAIQ